MNLAQLIGEKDLEIDKLRELLAGQGIEPDASKRVRELQALLDIEIKARAAEATAHKAREADLLAGIQRLRAAGATLPPPRTNSVTPAQTSPITARPGASHTKRNTGPRVLAVITAAGKPLRTKDIRAALPDIPEPNISVALIALRDKKQIARQGEPRSYEYLLPTEKGTP